MFIFIIWLLLNTLDSWVIEHREKYFSLGRVKISNIKIIIVMRVFICLRFWGHLKYSVKFFIGMLEWVNFMLGGWLHLIK